MLDTIDIDALPLSQAILLFLADPLILICIAICLLMLLHLRRNPPDWQAMAGKLNSRPWSVTESETMIMAVIIFILAGRAVISALYQFGIIQEDRIEWLLVVAQTVLFHFPVLAMILVILIRSKSITTGILGYQPHFILTAFRRGILYCFAALPIVGLASLIQSHFLTEAGFVNEPQYVVELFNSPGSPWFKIYLAFVTIVTAPIAEEFIFRGAGITALAGRIGTKWAVLLVSLAFAMIHFNLYSFLPLFTIAVAFSLAYIYSGSLLVAVFMHSVFNALNIAALLLVGPE